MFYFLGALCIFLSAMVCGLIYMNRQEKAQLKRCIELLQKDQKTADIKGLSARAISRMEYKQERDEFLEKLG